MTKRRLDIALVEAELVTSRSRAQDLIKRGKICLGGQVVSKPNLKILPTDYSRLSVDDHPWVSRSALKLVHAVKNFDIIINNKVCLDLGASTGGFTDVLLSHGAKHVYAVDVGQNQLHHRLKSNDKVDDISNQNARALTREHFNRPIELVVSDVSFISLKLALPSALSIAVPGATLVALIKPQFEVGKGNLGKGGVVRDPAQHATVCQDIQRWLENEHKWCTRGIIDSPIHGPDGNKEFLVWATRPFETD